MNDPKNTGWHVHVGDDEIIAIYDPATQQLKELGRWVSLTTYLDPAKLVKGELGRISGPVYLKDDFDK